MSYMKGVVGSAWEVELGLESVAPNISVTWIGVVGVGVPRFVTSHVDVG